MTETDQDPVELMLMKTGCIELHYKVQECIAETGDWRSCQEIVKEFRACMQVPLSNMVVKFLRNAYQLATNITSPPTKLALIVRTDLKMSKGKTAAQCAHAAVLCFQETQDSKETRTRQLQNSWLVQGQPKIVLKVEGGYHDLIKLQHEASQQGVVSALVQDAGRTQLAAGTATVLGIGPDTVENVDKLVGHLKLL